MSWTTLAGSAVADVAAAGLVELTTGEPLVADDMNFDLRDLLHIAKRALLSGVIVPGVITAASLVVTFPSGFAFFAGQIWKAGASTTKTVTDNATAYLWGCSDGVVRSTASAAILPTSFDAHSACLLVKVTAASGVMTLDTTVQQMARTADETGRLVSENNLTFAPVADTIPATGNVVVPANSQIQVFETLTVSGVLTVAGKVRVTE